MSDTDIFLLTVIDVDVQGNCSYRHVGTAPILLYTQEHGNMKKLKLDLGDLHIESFGSTPMLSSDGRPMVEAYVNSDAVIDICSDNVGTCGVNTVDGGLECGATNTCTDTPVLECYTKFLCDTEVCNTAGPTGCNPDGCLYTMIAC